MNAVLGLDHVNPTGAVRPELKLEKPDSHLCVQLKSGPSLSPIYTVFSTTISSTPVSSSVVLSTQYFCFYLQWYMYMYVIP